MSRRLPPQLKEIADIIGRDAMLKLVAECGGTRVYIPHTAEQDHHWIVRAIGRKAADKLFCYFGGGRIAVPFFHEVDGGGAYRTLMRTTQEQVEQLDNENISSARIAKMLRITQRTVHRCRQRRRAAEKR